MDYDLERFVAAQHDHYKRALGEIRRGRKQSHWMWFIFPQIGGLGLSDMARRYAIGSLAEARAYLAHPVLGARLLECVAALQDLDTANANAVFGSIDAMSCARRSRCLPLPIQGRGFSRLLSTAGSRVRGMNGQWLWPGQPDPPATLTPSQRIYDAVALGVLATDQLDPRQRRPREAKEQSPP